MLPRALLIPASLLPILAVACGNVVVDPSAGTGGSSSTAATSGVTTVTTGTGTTTTGSGGTGGTIACGETHDSLSIFLGTYDGKSFGCMGDPNGSLEMEATVVDAGGDFIAFDSCPPNADCLPAISKLVVSAPGLDLGSIAKGAFVNVRVDAFLYMGGCGQRIQILNLPQWAGAPNPVDQGERLWLLATDGSFGTFEDSPLVAETVPLGCYPEEPQGCGDHEDYAWRFRPAQNPDDPGALIGMGQTMSWFFKGGAFAQQVIGRNLRSFDVGYCDGPSEFAYWISNTYGLD